MDVNDAVDKLIESRAREPTSDELVSVIHPDIFFRRNSVNLIIARRSGGKTHLVLREILKCMLLGHKEYTQVWYISDKCNDDTVSKLKPLLEEHIQFNWITTKEAPTLFRALEFGKANPDEAEFRDCLNASELDADQTPHTFILFDDCIGLFNKTDALAKKLYQTRQSRITAFLMLQDVSGLNPSMKANIDSLVLFGGFPKHKFNVLFYQMPPAQFDFEDYAELGPKDCVVIDFIDGSVDYKYRE